MSTGTGARALRVTPAHGATWLAWSLAGIVGALAWSALAAHAHALGMEPVCVLRRVAHLACPTCGMTRALALFASGEWRTALALHPWGPVLAVQIVAGWALWGMAIASRGRGRLTRGIGRLEQALPHVVALNAAALVVLWLVRLATGTLPPI